MDLRSQISDLRSQIIPDLKLQSSSEGRSGIWDLRSEILFNLINQSSDGLDCDPDLITAFEREVIRRHDPSTRE